MFSTNFNNLIHLAETICEGIRGFLRIILIRSKSSPFLYEFDYFDHLKINLSLSYIKSVPFKKKFLIEAKMVHKRILFFSSLILISKQ